MVPSVPGASPADATPAKSPATLQVTPVQTPKRRECWVQDVQHPVESAGGFPSPGSLDEGGPQGGEPCYDLSTCPFRLVAGALVRNAGLLQPLGLLSEPYGPLQVRGVGVEVLAEGTGSTGLESSFLYGYGVAPSPGA